MFWAHGFMQCPFAMIWAHELNFPAEETAIKSKKVMTQLETMVCGGDGDDLSAARVLQRRLVAESRKRESRIREITVPQTPTDETIKFGQYNVQVHAHILGREMEAQRNARPKCQAAEVL